MSNEIATQRNMSPLETVLSTRSDQLKSVLPAAITPARFIEIAKAAALRNPELHQADAKSLFEAALACAQDGLLPNGREAFLSTHRNTRKNIVEATYIPMIAGVLKRILQSGEVVNIGATLVHEADEFDYYFSDGEEHVLHRPRLTGERGAVVGVYAFAKTKSGGTFFEYMSHQDVENVRKTSRQASNQYGPWVQHWGQMAKKTVIHRLSRRLPMSSEAQRVVDRDHDLYDYDDPRPAITPPASSPLPSTARALEALAAVPDAEIEAPDSAAPTTPAQADEPAPEDAEVIF